MFHSTITPIYIPFFTPALTVYIGTNGSSVAGNTLTLICNAIQETDITNTPELQWIGPDGLPILSGNGVAVGNIETVGTSTTLMLQFSPLSAFHEGQYTCQAYVGSVQLLRMSSHNITVQSMLVMLIMLLAVHELDDKLIA